MSNLNTSSTDAKSIIKSVLDRGEKCLWSDVPDPEVMQRSVEKFSRKTWIIIYIIVGVLLALALNKFWADSEFVENQSDFNWLFFLVAGLMVFFPLILKMRVDNSLSDYAKELVYGITDQRLLILRNGKIESEFTLAAVNNPRLRPCRGNPGFNDVVWGKRILRNRGSHKQPSPRDKERCTIGFKAMENAELVLQQIESWRQAQLKKSTKSTESFVSKNTDKVQDNNLVQNSESADLDIKAAAEKDTDQRIIKNSAHGFSIKLPASWTYSVRYRKIIFGKWGIEREPEWLPPEVVPKWNVIKMESATGSNVHIQVDKTKRV